MSNKNTIQYRQVGEYLILNFIIPPEEANIRLGKWGVLHKDYLKKIKRCFLIHCLFRASFISTVQMLKIRQGECLILLLSR